MKYKRIAHRKQEKESLNNISIATIHLQISLIVLNAYCLHKRSSNLII